MADWWTDPFLRGCFDAVDPEVSALDRLIAAALARRSVDLLIADLVSEARRFEHASWQDIGDVLGIARQAAQRKFGAKSHPPATAL